MKTIMTAGKGGTGKTLTLFYLLQRHWLKDLPGRVLVVDADPHQSLTALLPRSQNQPIRTLGQLRRQHNLSLKRGLGLENLSRRDFALQLAEEALAPLSGRADLLVMGRNDERGCQCVVNHILDTTLDVLAARYDWVIVDNEAGIEPIGRHAWPVDLLLLAASPKPMELAVAHRILLQAQDTGRPIRTACTLVNRYKEQTIVQSQMPTRQFFLLPYCEGLAASDQPGQPWLNAIDRFASALALTE